MDSNISQQKAIILHTNMPSCLVQGRTCLSYTKLFKHFALNISLLPPIVTHCQIILLLQVFYEPHQMNRN